MRWYDDLQLPQGQRNCCSSIAKPTSINYYQQNNIMDKQMIKAATVVFFVIVFRLLAPFLVIWLINLLFGTQIEITLIIYLAVFLLACIL